MDIKTLTDDLSVSPQIKRRDVSNIAALGFRTIINNRPDQEVRYQPRTQTLATYAERAGIHYVYLPVVPGNMTQQNVDDFATLLATAPGPVLAFCRTGTRSANLWARANPDDLSSAEISRIGTHAGYTL